MVGVIFPSKYEAEDLIGRLKQVEAHTFGDLECWKGVLEGSKKVDVVIGIVGIGSAHASRRTQTFLENVEISSLVLAGFAGGLSPQLERGQVFVAHGYSPDELINYLKLLPDFVVARLYTAEKVVGTPAEKAAMMQETGCQAVDMEVSGVAEVARDAGIDFICIRAVSDTAEEEIPVKILDNGYNPETGLIDKGRMARYMLTHPFAVGKLKKFLQPLPEVRKRLTNFLVHALPEL